MSTEVKTPIQQVFSSLPREEREAIIRYGVALRMSDLRKQLSLAESRVRQFEAQYSTTLEQLDTTGLPNNAGYKMHEDYILWHHWADVARKTAQNMAALQDIAQQGLSGGAADFEREVETLRGSQAFKRFLDKRAAHTRTIPLEGIEKELKQELTEQKKTA